MKRPDVPLALLQIRDLPLVMHQSHSESLAVHAAQRISCYKLPHKLHQVHSAQQMEREMLVAGVEGDPCWATSCVT